MINCKGFQSSMPIDPTVLKKQGDNCLLFNGHALSGGDGNQFAYAWDSAFNFYAVSSVTGTPCKGSLWVRFNLNSNNKSKAFIFVFKLYDIYF